MNSAVRRLLAAICGVVVIAGAGSIAWASIPDGSGVIHGCYQKNNGALRVVDTAKGQRCNQSEQPHNWSQQGGTGGSAVVARIRSTGAQATTESAANYPVTGGSWTQAADEIDTLHGVVDITVPSFVDCALYSQVIGQNIPPGSGSIGVYVDGNLVGSYATDSDGVNGKYPITFSELFEPGSSTSHTVTAQIQDNCEAPTLQDLQHFTINSLAIDVVGVH